LNAVAIASSAALEPGLFVTFVWSQTVTKVDSTGFEDKVAGTADAGYLAWLEANRAGFVINAYRNPTSGYLMLHRANCRTISEGDKSWTRDYTKVSLHPRSASLRGRVARSAVGYSAAGGVNP
jgi:hypothetical protein